MNLEATGGGYMQGPNDYSENVRLCMQDPPTQYGINNARRLRVGSAPVLRSSFEPRPPRKNEGDSPKRTLPPYATRSTLGYIGGGAFEPVRTRGIPSYSALDDPHLSDYFQRKFSSQLLSPQLSSLHLFGGGGDAEAERMGLRGGYPRGRSAATTRREVTYNVSVCTTDKKGAGTMAPVFLCLKGEFGDFPRTRLVKKPGSSQKRASFKFSPGSTHVFPLRCRDIGDIHSIIIEHTGIDENDSWLLQHVEVKNMQTKQRWLFICNHWLSLFKEDGQVCRVLFPIKSSKTRYEIVTVTGDVENAGTDAQVSITLHGKTGITSKIKLRRDDEDNRPCFQRGQSDKFVERAPCVGPLTKIVIRHNDSGLHPDWFLERIVVTDLKHPKWCFFFNCGQWLSRTHGDGAIARELMGSRAPDGISKPTEYKVSIYTGTKTNAGTAADVFVQLFGKSGHGQEVPVKAAHGFKLGSVVDVTIPSNQLGPLTKLKIGHNNKGMAPGWFLEKVIVDDLKLNKVYEFPCHRWLAKDADDGLIVRELHCKRGVATEKGIPFEIRVTTGDKPQSSTSARVYIELYGPENLQRGRNKDKGKKAQRHDSSASPRNSRSRSGDRESLDRHKAHEKSSGKVWLEGGKFKRGRTEVFKIDVQENFSPLTKIIIGHDNSGDAPGWLLDNIVINCPLTGVEQTFPCGEWLSRDEGDGTIEKTLHEDSSRRKVRDKKVPCLVSVYTSDLNRAGTDANIYLVAYGNKGKTDDILLTAKKGGFERGCVDKFKLEMEDIGLPYKLRVGHDNSGTMPGWHLDKVIMEKEAEGQEYVFRCGRWLSMDEEDHAICREMPAVGPGIKVPAKICHYKVLVYTGKRAMAGTDANVFINIYGDKGDTGDRLLTHSATHKNKFEKGQTDEFMLEAVDLGKLSKIKIGHDGKNPGAGWFLDKVAIQQLEDPNIAATFECFRWFDTKEDDGLIVREIKGSTMLDKITYEVVTKTGKIRNGGTDANVFIKVFGSRGDTGQIQLKTSSGAENKFEQGRTDTFKIVAEDIGQIKKIRIWHDGTGPGAGWFLDEVQVLIPHHGKRYVFIARRWLAVDEADGKLEVELEPTEVMDVEKTIHYEVTVYTGNKKGAGTDANVFLQIYGANGIKTETHPLRNKSDNFEQGMVDKFKLNALDVGPIQKIRIGHGNEGSAPGWYLEKVLIQRIAPAKRKKRPVDKAKGRGDNDEFERSDSARRRSDDRRGDRARGRDRRENEEDEKLAVITGDEEIESYWFLCNKWFARDEGDGRIVRELLPTTEDGRPISKLNEGDYLVTVKTGDVANAGTNANVHLTLYGTNGDTGEVYLKTAESGTIDKFERNQTDQFKIRAIELGELKKVKIRHDNTGAGGAWFLDYIHVVDSVLDREYLFPCYRWLARDKDDGLISRELIPVDRATLKRWKGGEDIRESVKMQQEDKLTTYKIRVLTGTPRGAGTDANVHVILFGKENDTGLIPLKTSLIKGNKFEAGRMDEFNVKAIDIGTLKKIRIGHDNSGGNAAWYLEHVEIDAPKLGYTWVFPCSEWIGKDVGNGALEMDLYPKADSTMVYVPRVTYEVTVYTSDVRGAGTNANIYLQVYGRDSETEKTPLAPGVQKKGKFDQKSVDKFYLEMNDVGDPIEKIRIGHDGHGIGAGWHLDRVEIRKLKEDKKGSITYVFPCNRWLARDEDDHAIERELLPVKVRDESAGPGGKGRVQEKTIKDGLRKKKYKINVYTGSVDGAGTDANVFLNVFGELGDTGERKLVNSETYQNKFEKGHMDVFTWEAVDIGNVHKLKIRHDNSALLKSSWFLDKVEVIDLVDKETYVFYCERWLSTKKDDKRIERSLYVVGYEGEMSSRSTVRSGATGSTRSIDSLRDGSRSPRQPQRVGSIEDIPQGPVIPYTIRLTTGPDKDMGTAGPVWVRIHGNKNLHTGRLELQPINKNRFDPGSVDTFSIEAVDVKEVKKLEIGNDAIGHSAGWYVADVLIDLPTKGKRYHFPCKTWLSREKSDGKTSRIFNHSDSTVSTHTPMITYEMTIYTGDVDRAGTDSGVFVQAFGAHGISSEVPLDKAGERFERGRRDTLLVEMEDVGAIKKLRVGHDGRGSRQHWFLEKVELRNMKSLDLCQFKFNDWLSTKIGNHKQLSVDMPAIVGGKEQVARTDYKVAVKTSNVSGAGTDANVYVRLFGEHGDSGDIHLAKPDRPQRPFQNGQTDEFTISNQLQLGALARCQVWHDNKGLGPAWHLEWIKVVDMRSRRHWQFPCNKWLSTKDDDKQIMRDLVCQATPGESLDVVDGKTEYDVEILTTDREDAGMRHNAWIVIEGKQGTSRAFKMVNQQEDKIFSRGQSDAFVMPSRHLGELRYLYIGAFERQDRPLGHVTGKKAMWHCYAVYVTDKATGKRYEFLVNKWLPIQPTMDKEDGLQVRVNKVEEDASKQLVKNIRERQTVKYEVAVHTGDQMGAGTNANVSLTLYGENNIDSGKRQLKQSGRDLFERKQIDKFLIECIDLGEVEKIKIEHDNAGIRPDWYLGKVIVTNQESGHVWTFPCNQWLSTSKGDKQLWKVLFPE